MPPNEDPTVSKHQRRWFFQINVNTGDLATLAKIRQAIENLTYLDESAAITERTMICKLVDTHGGEVFIADDEGRGFSNVN